MNHIDASRTAVAPAEGDSRLPAPPCLTSGRRTRLLEEAAEQFSIAGMNGTPMADLAKVSGVSEPMLYREFGSKRGLFREAVKTNMQRRLRELDRRLSVIDEDNDLDWVAPAVAATILVCLCDDGNATLTNWALLEDREYAAGLHRDEIGAVATLWERELGKRIPESVSRAVRCHLGMIPIYACLSYGLWLVALGHTEETAEPFVRQFAAGVMEGASAILQTRLGQNGMGARTQDPAV